MKKIILVLALFLICALPSIACDFCGIYTPLTIRERNQGSIDLGIREDLLGYSKTRQDGKDIERLGNQNQKINVTELTAQYALTNRFSVLLGVPFISENIKRRVDDAGAFESDSKSGVGDVGTYIDVVLARKALKNGGYFQWDFFGGVKLPSGSTDRLQETSQDWPYTGMYGGAVSIGTGSYDFPVATGFRSDSNDWLVDAIVQYNIRTEGDYRYTYGNDLRWSIGAGRRLADDGGVAMEAQLFFSGLTKDADEQDGESLKDSGQSFIAIGPRVELVFSNRYSLWARVDVPVSHSNDGLQTLQGHRVQFGFNANL